MRIKAGNQLSNDARTLGFGSQWSIAENDGDVELTNGYQISPVFNVKDLYGAKGDGTTDDRAAIQAAINACSAAGGGIVYLPTGTYFCNWTNDLGINGRGAALVMKTGVTLLGAGKRVSTIKVPVSIGAYDAAWCLASDASGTSHDWAVRSLGFNGQQPGATETSQYIFDPFFPTSDFEFSDCYFTAFGAGCYIHDQGHGGSTRWAFRRCIWSNTNNVSISFSEANDFVIEDNLFYDSRNPTSGGETIGITSGTANMKGGRIVGNTVDGRASITVHSTGGFTISDVVIADNVLIPFNDSNCILFESDTGLGLYNITVTGNVLDGSRLPASQGAAYSVLSVKTGQGLVIADNTIICATGNYGVNLGDTGATLVDLVFANNTVGPNAGTGTVDMSSINVTGTFTNPTFTGNVVGGIIFMNNPTAISGMTFTGNSFAGAGGNYNRFFGVSNSTIMGNYFGAQTGTPANKFGLQIVGSCSTNIIAGNQFVSSGTDPALADNGTGGSHVVANNIVTSINSPTIDLSGAGSELRHNTGYNPVGVATVAVPATTVAVAAANYDRTFYVTANAGGSVTMAIQNGPSVLIPASAVVPVKVPAGKTVTPTYTSAPTWVVEGE